MYKPNALQRAGFQLLHKKFFLLLLLLLAISFNAAISYGQTTYTWNQTGTASWAVAANWTPNRASPATNDVLVFNNAASTTVTAVPTQTIGQLLVSGSTTVNLQAATAATVLSIAGGAGTDLSVAAGSALNNNGSNAMAIIVLTGATGSITGNMAFSAANHTINAADASGIIFNSPAVFTQDIGCTGSVFTTTGTANAIVFGTGTLFLSKDGATPFGLTQPNSKVVFQTGNLYKIQQGGLFDYHNRTYADLEIDFVAFHYTVVATGNLNVDNFTITNGYAALAFDGPDILIKGNLTVASGGSLYINTYTSPAADTVRFKGTAPQTISNAGILSIGNASAIVFDNPAGISINSNLTINGPVKFVSGIVTVPNPNSFTFGPLATVISFSNSSFADGRIAKIGNTAFTFPIGKTTCGPSGTVKGTAALSISNFTGGAATDQFTAEYKRGSAYALGSITAVGLNHISSCDYWTLTRDVGTSTVDIALAWDDPTNNCNSGLPYVNNPASLTIAHNDNSSGSTWNTMAVAGATTGNSITGTVSWAAPQSSSFGAFAIGSINFLNPLPVTVSYFTGSRQNDANLLNWKFSGIAEPLTCTLERSADDATFSSIYSTTADVLRSADPFSYTDATPPDGISYYRLAITAPSGKITYSATVALQHSADGFTVTGISPNPVRNTIFKLNVAAAKPLAATIIISDLAGRKVKQQTAMLTAGFNSIAIDPAGMAAGTYTISIISGGLKAESVRFVKQ